MFKTKFETMFKIKKNKKQKKEGRKKHSKNLCLRKSVEFRT